MLLKNATKSELREMCSNYAPLTDFNELFAKTNELALKRDVNANLLEHQEKLAAVEQ